LKTPDVRLIGWPPAATTGPASTVATTSAAAETAGHRLPENKPCRIVLSSLPGIMHVTALRETVISVMLSYWIDGAY
jgi:hypothetical protein